MKGWLRERASWASTEAFINVLNSRRNDIALHARRVSSIAVEMGLVMNVHHEEYDGLGYSSGWEFNMLAN